MTTPTETIPDWSTSVVTPEATFRVSLGGPLSSESRARLTDAAARHTSRIQGQTWSGGTRLLQEQDTVWIEFSQLGWNTTADYLRHYLCKVFLPSAGGPADGPDDEASWLNGRARLQGQLQAAFA